MFSHQNDVNLDIVYVSYGLAPFTYIVSASECFFHFLCLQSIYIYFSFTKHEILI